MEATGGRETNAVRQIVRSLCVGDGANGHSEMGVSEGDVWPDPCL